jgi:hypothetical protein
MEHVAEVWNYIVGQALHMDVASASCAAIASHVDGAWIRRVVADADTNRSRGPTDPVWQLVQSAPFSEVPTRARRLMRCEQHVHSVEQLDVAAYGYLVSRTALLHPQGETFDVSMGLQGLVQSLTKIAAQPEKDFGELVRRRRRKRGLSVAPAGKILTFLQAHRSDDPAKRVALDAAAERLLWSEGHGDEMHESRVRLAERCLHETLLALDQAEVVNAPAWKRGGLEAAYAQEMKAYERLLRRDDGSSKACE